MLQKAIFFLCEPFSLFVRDLSLREKITSEIRFSKPLSGCPLFFKRIVKLCTSLLNEELDQ